MNKALAVVASKTFRKKLDDILQEMKGFRNQMQETVRNDPDFDKSLDNSSEAIANHVISIRDLESAIMRQGMVLKNIGNPDPYPESRNPDSPVVEPTADGLKL